MNTKKMTLMIFFPDGRSRNVPFNLSVLLKGLSALMLLFFFVVFGLTGYNAWRLHSVRKEHFRTSRSVTEERNTVFEHLKSLENFEEKISFYLGGALTDHEGVNVALDKENYSGGVGGGDDSEVDGNLPEGAGLADIPAAPVIPEGQEQQEEKLTPLDSSNIELRIEMLRDRLEELAVLAVKEKTRLDLTPSIPPSPGYITSHFGWRRSPFTGRRDFHRGIDLVNKIGTPIKATASGRVIFAGKEMFWGNAVFIEHQEGVVTKYGHMSSINVKEGDKITRGQVIGFIGMTGRTTGPHVHYQIELDGQPVDPMQFIIDESDIN
ncbi:M23 family metallopeptidase [bacterium]|nr:M23 family metallopeptidase [bacterium]